MDLRYYHSYEHIIEEDMRHCDEPESINSPIETAMTEVNTNIPVEHRKKSRRSKGATGKGAFGRSLSALRKIV
jgi:hypothetical protein